MDEPVREEAGGGAAGGTGAGRVCVYALICIGGRIIVKDKHVYFLFENSRVSGFQFQLCFWSQVPAYVHH